MQKRMGHSDTHKQNLLQSVSARLANVTFPSRRTNLI